MATEKALGVKEIATLILAVASLAACGTAADTSTIGKNHKPTMIYEGNGRARFRHITYNGNGYNPGEFKPGACVFKMDPPATKSAK